MQRMNANYTVTSRNAIQILKSTSTISNDFPEKFNVLFVVINLSANRQMQLQQIQISNINMILVVNWAWLICGNSMEVWLVWIFLSIIFICCFCCTWNTNISINSLFGFVCVFHINRSMFGKRRIHDIQKIFLNDTIFINWLIVSKFKMFFFSGSPHECQLY